MTDRFCKYVINTLTFASVALLMIFFAQVCSANIKIQMLNVGQGDAILIRTGAQTVLIDASDVDETDKLLRELGKAGIGDLDKLILTHPHADHIGGDGLCTERSFSAKPTEVREENLLSNAYIQNYWS